MQNTITKWLVAVVAVSIVSVGLLILQKDRIAQLEREFREPRKVGDRVSVPGVIHDVISKQTKNLRSATLFIFFDTNCPSCVNEAPLWNSFHRSHLNDVSVVGVSRSPVSELENFASNLGMMYPVFHDPDGNLFREFRVTSVPFDVLVVNGVVAVSPSSHSAAVQFREVEHFLESRTNR